MINKVIQSLWIGPKLSAMEQLCISSYQKNGHDFHLYTYGVVEGVPEGTIIKDANEVLSSDLIFTYHNNSYAGFADWFRWVLLSKRGGIWVDTDMICLKPIDINDDIIFGLESNHTICPAFLKFPPQHGLSVFLEKLCRNPNTFLPYDKKKDKFIKIKRRLLSKGRDCIRWGETGGPKGFTKAVNHFGLFHKAKPFTHFFPIHCDNWKSLFDETLANDKSLFNDSYTVHMWNEMTRRSQVDKNGKFPSISLYEQLKSKYL